MDLILTTLLIVIVSFLIFLVNRKPKNYPPGPRRWPLIGSLPSMLPQPGDSTFDIFDRLRKNHGNLIGLHLGSQPTILVSGLENVKKICAAEEFLSRPHLPVTQHAKFGSDKKLGLIFAESGRWKTQRRFTLRHLRDFGFGKRSMDHYIQEQVQLLFSAIDTKIIQSKESSSQEGIDILPILPVVAINSLWYIIAGERHDLDDEQFVRLTKTVLTFFRVTQLQSPVGFFKVLQHVPIINRNFQEQLRCGTELCDFVEVAVKKHLNTYDEGHMRDFIDVFIKEMKQDVEYFTEEQLIASCVDLFLAGTETSSGLLSFTMRYMLWHPDIQEKVREEIYKVVGKERTATMDDITESIKFRVRERSNNLVPMHFHSSLPYCNAVLTESLRHSLLTPFAPPRSNAADAVFNGYHIPKRSMILVNLGSVHGDVEHWGDPKIFRPERFIDSAGKFRKDDHLILFGTGPRFCLGEPFARNSSFLLFTSLMQNYKMEVPPNGAAPLDKILPGITAAPVHFKVKVTKL